MTNVITQTILDAWLTSRKTKKTPAGWISGNSVCCSHRGESPDTRMRGGLMVINEAWTYSCFNCHFKTGWSPGYILSKKHQDFMGWLGINSESINKLVLESIKNKESLEKSKPIITNSTLVPKDLPPNTKSFIELAGEDCSDENFINCVSYLLERGFDISWYNWMWSPEPGYQDRIIIPFYHNKAIVGFTSRKITAGSPKYISVSQPSYVFNIDNQTENRKFTLASEGVLDAVAIDGISFLKNTVNKEQLARVSNLGKEIILIPDNDLAGIELIEVAIDQNWYVSLPDWDVDIKDPSDAVKKYGRLYTINSIISSRTKNLININLIKNRIIKNHELRKTR